jgi:hypothetical protein
VYTRAKKLNSNTFNHSKLNNIQHRRNHSIPNQRIDLLEYFAKAVNLHQKMELGITINIGGVCVSGKLISAKKFYEGLSANFENLKIVDPSEDSSTNEEEIKKGYKDFFDRIKASVPQNEEELKHFNMRYLYLKDARFYSGFRAMPVESGVYWIGKLTSVDGFFIGTLDEAI